MHYPRNTVGKKKRKYRSLTCHTVPGLSFLSQKATCFVFLNRFFSYNKNKQTSQAAASRRIKQREEATRHHHVSRTCTWPCSVLLHHSLTQTHRQTHTQHTHTQTDSHATFEKKKNPASDISQNPCFLAVPKPTRHLWQFIFYHFVS